MTNTLNLGINIDHVATLRQARGTRYPDPLHAAFEAVSGGADNITLHLREDKRHIQERDVLLLKQQLTVPMNFEMAVTPPMLDFAEKLCPEQACLVPEKREELTTEGGLDVRTHLKTVTAAVQRLASLGIQVSLFIDPEIEQIDATIASGAPEIELHTGCYADAQDAKTTALELERIRVAALYAHQKGLIVHAGHGLHYQNVRAVAEIPVIHTLNIGHAIIARAIFCGLQTAVKHMRDLCNLARPSIKSLS